MKTMKMSFFFTEIGREKDKILIFHVMFLNKDISITVAVIVLKCCMSVLHVLKCSFRGKREILYGYRGIPLQKRKVIKSLLNFHL